MKVEGRAKKGGKGRERRFCFFPVLSLLLHPIFLLSFQPSQQTNAGALATWDIGTPHGRLFIVLEDLQYSPSDSHGNAYWRILFKLSFAACFLFSLICIGSQVNYKLRKLAETIGPDAVRLERLANSVEEFTYRLLDPLKTHLGRSKQFGDYSLDEMLIDAIEFKQKKVGNKLFDIKFHS